jgi:ribonuclease HII
MCRIQSFSQNNTTEILKQSFSDFDISLKNKLKLKGISVIPLVRGDSKSKTISLASIIAKETRDSIMKNFALKFPLYYFEKNFGYGTLKHREAILKYGITSLHRKSFKPISTICSK